MTTDTEQLELRTRPTTPSLADHMARFGYTDVTRLEDHGYADIFLRDSHMLRRDGLDFHFVPHRRGHVHLYAIDVDTRQVVARGDIGCAEQLSPAQIHARLQKLKNTAQYA